MPATGSTSVGLIVFDIRSLRLPLSEGKAVEAELREALFDILRRHNVDLDNKSGIDLSEAVFGLAIE